MRTPIAPTLLAPCLILAACAAPNSGLAPGMGAGTSGPSPTLVASAECQAARLKPVEPLPTKAIPDEVLRRAQTGWVAVGYDVVDGKVQNAKVLSSQPVGLYDGYVLRHVGGYSEPSGATVRGCLSTTHIRF